MAILAGALVASRYRLGHRIASGGLGEVWEATDRVLGRRVAVKLLRADLARGKAFRDRFRAEARAAARLTHPGVIGVYDYGTHDCGADGSTLFLVMELVEGETLSALLTRRGPLDAALTMSIVSQAASVLAAAQELGLVHEDVEPANLLLQPDGRVKIADFGVARRTGASTLTASDPKLGTLEVALSEHVPVKDGSDPSEVYRLGVVAYECLTGAPPFDGGEAGAAATAQGCQPAPALPAAVPEEVRRLVEEMLGGGPGRRVATAAALADIAGQLAETLTGDALPFLPATGPATAADERPRLADGGRGVPARRRRSKRGELQRGRAAVTASIATAVVLVIGLTLTAGAAPSTVRVPDLRGQLEHAASSSLTASDLTAGDRVVDIAGAGAELVVGQRPRAGARVKPGTRVVLTTASGYVVLPPQSLDGLSYSAALSVLRREGLRAAQLAVALGPGGAGRVVAYHPEGRLKEGTVVTLSVAPPLQREPAVGPSIPMPAPTTVDAVLVPSGTHPQGPPSPDQGHHHGSPDGPPGPPHGNGKAPPSVSPSTPPPGTTGPGTTPPAGNAGTTPSGGPPPSSSPLPGAGTSGGTSPSGTPAATGTPPPGSSSSGSGGTPT